MFVNEHRSRMKDEPERGGEEVVFAMDWPEAIVWTTAIASAALVVSVLIWSIFQTGRTAIRTESGRSTES
jgi:hypothetical protein